MFYGPVFGGVVVEQDRVNRYAGLHIQTWVYIHSAVSTIVCILGIAVGILLLLQPSWHEFLILYRQLLAYLRRSDPTTYWTCYRVFLSCWIGIHFAHLLTVSGTILGVQMTKSRLVVPQIVILVCEIGIYIIGTFILIVISVTGSKVTWIALTGVLFFGFFASTNLALLVTYHRILDERNVAVQALLAARSVHFKERQKPRRK